MGAMITKQCSQHKVADWATDAFVNHILNIHFIFVMKIVLLCEWIGCIVNMVAAFAAFDLSVNLNWVHGGRGGCASLDQTYKFSVRTSFLTKERCNFNNSRKCVIRSPYSSLSSPHPIVSSPTSAVDSSHRIVSEQISFRVLNYGHLTSYCVFVSHAYLMFYLYY